ncbi:Nucleic acid-binding protein [Corchorus olitorius]|uniref:Nucleic acid-binding protein n=1 Tax=Corchorus olitorius TaxID=93759 RepID=A0A1R3GGV5_9ROSI|nr:Nucleic acid-binding protein [Corchorus olitorius]
MLNVISFVVLYGNAIQAFIDIGIVGNFRNRLIEGKIYKIFRFQVVECKAGYNAIPSEYIIKLNSSTVMDEVCDDTLKIPRHYFMFAMLEQIKDRKEKDPTLTDIIGLLMSVSEAYDIQRSTGEGTFKIIDTFVKLLSGDIIRVCLWEGQMDLLRVDYIRELDRKPVIVVVGSSVRNYLCVPLFFVDKFS